MNYKELDLFFSGFEFLFKLNKILNKQVERTQNCVGHNIDLCRPKNKSNLNNINLVRQVSKEPIFYLKAIILFLNWYSKKYFETLSTLIVGAGI